MKRLSLRLRTIWLKVKTRLGGAPIWQIQEGHIIEPAFIAGGIQYYKVRDQFNTHTLRGMSAVEIYDKWNMRMERSTLVKYIDELQKCFNAGKSIDLNRVVSLINGMRDRLDFVLPPQDYLWDLFCVTYFDTNESPYSYDPDYQVSKKERLKQSGDIDDFFLFTRLSELLPLPKLSADDLAAAFRVIQQLDELNLANLYRGVPEPEQSKSL
jgi:hypothetical protein